MEMKVRLTPGQPACGFMFCRASRAVFVASRHPRRPRLTDRGGGGGEYAGMADG